MDMSVFPGRVRRILRTGILAAVPVTRITSTPSWLRI
jgi:hypothetical protein